MYLTFGFLLGFAIVGSIEARMRKLLRPSQDRLAGLREDLERIEDKLELLLRHNGLSKARVANKALENDSSSESPSKPV